jgi:hypothetical protein
MDITSEWRRSTKCGSAPDCAEVRMVDGLVEVRNSAAPDAGTATFTRSEWRAFVAGIAAGEFEA